MIAIINEPLLSSANAGANINSSAACNVSRMSRFSLQSISTNTATGTIQVQVSNDPPSEGSNAVVPTNWTNLSGATITVTAASILILPEIQISHNWLQVTFTHTGGSGNLTVNLCAHEI